MTDPQPKNIYQLKLYLKRISPMIWRRILVHQDTTISDLHKMMQILMGWQDLHLHHFLIRGKRYGVPQPGTWGFMDDPNHVSIDQFQFRLNETFLYEYNYYDRWELLIRVEAKLPEDGQFYPRCIAGKRTAPHDDIGGAWRFMELKQHYSFFYVLDRIRQIIDDPELEENREYYTDEVRTLQYWLLINQFVRREMNKKLREQFRVSEEENI